MANPQTPTTGEQPRRATVADHLVDRLVQRRDDTRFMQVRHEETAGFAASAHVKYGGGPIGAALATSGPGAMLVGQGAYGAEAEVAVLAHRLGAGVATALLGMPAVDQREPWVTGSIGLLGTTPSWHLMQHCDRLPTAAATLLPHRR